MQLSWVDCNTCDYLLSSIFIRPRLPRWCPSRNTLQTSVCLKLGVVHSVIVVTKGESKWPTRLGHHVDRLFNKGIRLRTKNARAYAFVRSSIIASKTAQQLAPIVQGSSMICVLETVSVAVLGLLIGPEPVPWPELRDYTRVLIPVSSSLLRGTFPSAHVTWPAPTLQSRDRLWTSGVHMN